FFEEHKVEFSEMFKKMGDPSTGIHHETQFFLNELIERAPESKKSEAYNALNIVFNGEKQPSKKDAALSTLEVITSRTSTDEEKDRAEETLREAINSIPWSKIKEATPPKSTLATLGFGGIRIFNKNGFPFLSANHVVICFCMDGSVYGVLIIANMFHNINLTTFARRSQRSIKTPKTA
ncbi:MAG: hypothetical protein P8Y45_22580, partial [Exilibacterium sp.]